MSKIQKIKVSIIYVYYKNLEDLLRSIRSVLIQKVNFDYEIIVVDNSKEKNVSRYIGISKKIKYVKSPRNLGYGGGNNLGFKYALGEYLLILNPDTLLKTSSTLNNLARFLDQNKDAAIVAPFLLDEDGNISLSQGTRELTPLEGIFSLSFINKVFPNNPVSRNYFMKDIEWRKRKEKVRLDVVPGSAFMIRSTVFNKIGGFDEHFFLYFEESDLCKKVNKIGKIYMIPHAQVVHYGQKSKDISEKLKKIFAKSRFYYFKKHYGLHSAILVELFARFSKYYAILLGILALGLFLRLYRIGETMAFFGDIGWYFLQARDMILKKEFPLVGIPSSVPILRQGAIWTWLLAFALMLGNFNPISGAVLSSIIGLIAVLGIFFLLSKIYDRETGLIGSVLTATSPYIVFIDRLPFQTIGIFPLTVLIGYLFIKAYKSDGIYWFLLGASLSVIFQFELAAFILGVIIIIAFQIIQRRKEAKNLLKLFAGAFWGGLPFLLWDIKNGVFIQTIGFFIWVVMKVYESFLGIDNIERGLSIVSPFFTYLKEVVLPIFPRISFVLFLISFVLFVFSLIKNRTKSLYFEKLIIIWFFLAIVSFFVRGTFSEAYLPLLFLPTISILTLFFKKIYRYNKNLALSIIFTIVFLNSFSVILRLKNEYPIFREKIQVANFILDDTAGKSFSLRFLGPGYQFHSGQDHWVYLLWWKGKEPNLHSDLEYTIVEQPYSLVGEFDKVYNFKKITLGVKTQAKP